MPTSMLYVALTVVHEVSEFSLRYIHMFIEVTDICSIQEVGCLPWRTYRPMNSLLPRPHWP